MKRKAKERFFIRAIPLAVFLLVGLLPLGGLSQAAEREKVTFNTDWVFYGRDLGWFAAQSKGFFAEAGLDVQIVRGFGSGDTVKKIATGTHEYTNADIGTLVRARAQGMKLQTIGVFHDKSLYVIFTTKDKGIQKPKGLEGHTIGIAQGSALIQVFPALASVNRIDESKVKWTFMDAPVTMPALLAGKIDATLTFNTIYPIFSASAKRANKTPVAILWSDFGVDIYSSGLIVTDERIRDKSDQVRRFTVAAMKGNAFAVEHPEEALDMFMKDNPSLNRALTRATWEITVDHLLTPYQKRHGLGQISKEKMESTRDIMTKYAKLPVKVPVEDLYTNQFLPKLFPKRPSK